MTHAGTTDDIKYKAIFYDICTRRGQSGSPVYFLNEPTKVVGIHKAKSVEDQKNLATMITEDVVKTLKIWSV
jgi:V8-like Glu-specific endopeptidase